MQPISSFYDQLGKESKSINTSQNMVDPVRDSNVGQTITIQNIRIDFPVKPYAAQIQMMNKIINALNNNENALLESPTGSGKSLALLCAVLAWRENQERIAAAEIKKKKQESLNKQDVTQKPKQLVTPVVKKQVKTRVIMQNEIDDDFQQPITKRFIGEVTETTVEHEPAELATLDEIKALKYDTYKQVPRIFIGSRTHKQIAQLVSELKNKTKYRPRTTILGSRDHLCIHPKVKDSFKKTEDCTELLEKDKCTFAKRTNQLLANPSLKTHHRVWDIEDMVNLGKVTKGCPYYAARKLYEGAEVIFCPYNYIIDPVIRKILDINLKNSIIILDEAHNIEDASRSAGSFEIDEHSIDILLKELASVVKYGGEKEAHKTLEVVITSLFDLMTSESTVYTSKEYEKQSCHFTGQALLDKLRDIHISKNTFEAKLLPAYKKASAHADLIRKELENKITSTSERMHVDYENDMRSKRILCLSNSSLTLVQGIFLVLGFLCHPESDYSNDYEMVLMKTIDRQGNSNKRRKTVNQQIARSLWTHKLAFWCLNPGVIFQNMCETTHSVILASGTLSPLNTFASELGTKFTGRLEANHVIKPSQVWVNAIPNGPNRVALKGVYSNIESLQYQDEVGEALCDIVERVPYGVLCFMPSYKSLDLMMERWKLTGMMDRIQNKKLVFTEPRGKDKTEFEDMLNKFYEKIKLVECGIEENEQNGALLFAVFRGKVSEGIDFSDNNCRAVVTLGIPYPGFKDLEITLKRDYNNRLKSQQRDREVLSGNDWYYAQAYRAINQALGRCIRHKDDWGAIILLEERFTRPENVNGLSKWVKSHLSVMPNYEAAMASLKDFVQTQTERVKEEKKATDTAVDDILADPPLMEKKRKMEAIDLELPDIINLDDSFEKSFFENSQDSSIIEVRPPLGSIENGVRAKPVQKKKQLGFQTGVPYNYTQLSCKSCQSDLVRGPIEYIKPVSIDDLSCFKNTGLVMHLQHPGVWETSSSFTSGPLDVHSLPISSQVTYNRQDSICYKPLTCQCDKQVGVLICLATSDSKQHHVGNVYMFENRMDRVINRNIPYPISQEDVENALPNSQYSATEDIFFNL